MRAPRPHADPYVAGFFLGLVLLASFVLAGRGLGASGAFTTVAAAGVAAVSPARVAASPMLARHADWQREWLLYEIGGVVLGGFLSSWIAGRFRLAVERGPRTTPKERLVLAFGGGTLMGAGALLARGCTSGLGLTGGALLAVGSWIFIASAFAAAYLVAPLLRRTWL